MTSRICRILRAAGLSLSLVASFAAFSPVLAEKDQGSRYLEDLKKTRQDLIDARNAMSSLKSLYADKEIQVRDLKIKLDNIKENLRRCQDSIAQLNKEKESLLDQQNKNLLQLKQSEAEKFILTQQNQVLANCSKENEAKSRELTALRNSYAQDKKDLLGNVQNNETKLADLLAQKDALAQAKSELEVRCSLLTQQLTDIKNQQVNCLDDKRDLVLKVQELQRQIDSLHDDLNYAQSSTKDLQDASQKIKRQEGFESELAQLRRKYAQVDNELKLSEAENKRLSQLAIQYDKEDGLKQELVNLRKALSKSEEQKVQIQEVCDKLKKQEAVVESKFADLTRKFTALQEENKKLRNRSGRISDEDAIKNELTCLRQDLSKCKDDKKQLEQYSSRGKRDSADLGSDLALLRERIAQLEAENKSLQATVSRSSGKIRVDRTKNPAATDPLELAQLRSALAGLESERDRLRSETEQLREQQENLLRQLALVKKVPAESGSIVVANPNPGSNMGKLKQDLQATQELSYELVQEKAGYRKREKELTQSLLETQGQKAYLEQEKADLLRKNKSLEAEYAKLSEQLAKAVVQLSDLDKQKQSNLIRSTESQQELRFIQDKLKSCEQFALSLQAEAEKFKRANKDLEVKVYNAGTQKEQDVALVKAQLEQLNALKEGEYIQLNNKFQDYRAQKEIELKSLKDSIAKLKFDLQNSQELSFQMVQEKTSLSGQQKQASEQLKNLRDQKSLLEQEKRDLEKQNIFLKNQYVSATQELDGIKKDSSRIGKGRSAASQEELEYLKRQSAEKEQEYLKKIKEYETRYQDLGATDKDKSGLIDELAKLRNNYQDLKSRYEISEEARKNLQTLKDRYGKLPEENANLHYNLGVLYAQHQEYPKAVAELEKVTELKPNDAEAYYNLGVINGEYLGNRKKSLVYFEKYLALAPNDPEADRIRKYIVTWKTLGQEPDDK
jgi:chromosome segregation ATPase